MKLRENIFTTLLLTIGLIMHQITPGILGGMKFDFLLIFMVVSILLNYKINNIILTGVLSGILSAMTTTFPGGQVPNLLDKVITAFILYIIIKFFGSIKNNKLFIGIIGGLSTLISGTIFLTSASILVGLPTSLGVLFVSVILPTSIINTIGTIFIYKLIRMSIERIGIV